MAECSSSSSLLVINSKGYLWEGLTVPGCCKSKAVRGRLQANLGISGVIHLPVATSYKSMGCAIVYTKAFARIPIPRRPGLFTLAQKFVGLDLDFGFASIGV